MKTIFLFASLLFLGSTCNKEKIDCHKTITIFNNSKKDIYVLCDTQYPDTLYFGHFSSPASDSSKYKVPANSSSDNPLRNRDCWENDFTYGDLIASDTLMVYVFDANVVETVDWADVVHYYMVLKRYDLSMEDLKSMNWTITYPPPIH